MAIVSVNPSNGQEYVPVTTTVTITFDSTIDHSLINHGTVVIYAPGDTLLSGPLPNIKTSKLLDDEPNEYNLIKGSFEITDYDSGYGANYTTIVFTPTRPLHEFNTYVCIISNEVLGGDTVYKWSFTTGDEHVEEVPPSGLPTGPTIVIGNSDSVSPIEGVSNLFILNSSFPVSGSYDVEITTGTIVLVFNREIDPTSVDASKFTIIGSAADGSRDKISHGIVPIESVQVIGNKIYLHLVGGA